MNEYSQEYGPSAILSVIFLSLCIVVAPPITVYTSQSELAVVRGLGLLLVPACFAAWIYHSIRGLHERDLRMFSLRSTYVIIIFTVLALIMIGISGLGGNSHHLEEKRLALAFLSAGALLFLGALAWSFWYNWRVTADLWLTVSVTLLQTLVMLSIFVLIFLWMGTRKSNHR